MPMVGLDAVIPMVTTPEDVIWKACVALLVPLPMLYVNVPPTQLVAPFPYPKTVVPIPPTWIWFGGEDKEL